MYQIDAYSNPALSALIYSNAHKTLHLFTILWFHTLYSCKPTPAPALSILHAHNLRSQKHGKRVFFSLYSNVCGSEKKGCFFLKKKSVDFRKRGYFKLHSVDLNKRVNHETCKVCVGCCFNRLLIFILQIVSTCDNSFYIQISLYHGKRRHWKNVCVLSKKGVIFTQKNQCFPQKGVIFCLKIRGNGGVFEKRERRLCTLTIGSAGAGVDA